MLFSWHEFFSLSFLLWCILIISVLSYAGQAALLKSVLKPGYEFDQLLVLGRRKNLYAPQNILILLHVIKLLIWHTISLMRVAVIRKNSWGRREQIRSGCQFGILKGKLGHWGNLNVDSRNLLMITCGFAILVPV